MDALLAQTLPLIHPELAGLAMLAGAVPILIHFINRRRYKRVPWAAMSFLLAANRRSTKRLRFEQLLLLLLRIALLVLLGLALARPFFPAAALLPSGAARIHRILLLDNSLSMSARDAAGVSRFEAAKAFATKLVTSLPAEDAVSLITMSSPAEAVVGHASFDRRFVRERLASVNQVLTSSDAASAIDLAGAILKQSEFPDDNRAIYVVSDFPRLIWYSGSAQSPAPAMQALQRLADALPKPDRDLTIVRLEDKAPDNVAVVSFSPQAPLVGTGIPIRLVITITNFGDEAVRDFAVQLRRDGAVLHRELIARLDAGKSHLLPVTTEFAEPGVHALEARMTLARADALPEDDARYLSLEVREAALVLLVDGGPGPSLLKGEAGYLATALSPGQESGELDDRLVPSGRRATGRISPIDTKIISESELPTEALSEYDVVALCNVARLGADGWRQLARFVESGGGLLITAGAQVSADDYNKQGGGLLAGRLGPVVSAPEGGEPLGFKLDRAVHPIVADFERESSSGLFTARVDRYLPLLPDSKRAEVVLRITDDAPALAVWHFGKGRVAYVATTANMEWTNLPSKGDFVSLFSNVVAYVSPRHGRHRNIEVGGWMREPLTARQSSLPIRVMLANGTSAEAALVSERDAVAAQFGPVAAPGTVALSIGPQKLPFAVNVDSSESDLAAIDDRQWNESLGRSVRILGRESSLEESSALGRATEIATPLLYLLTALLLVESWLAMRFGAPRK